MNRFINGNNNEHLFVPARSGVHFLFEQGPRPRGIVFTCVLSCLYRGTFLFVLGYSIFCLYRGRYSSHRRPRCGILSLDPHKYPDLVFLAPKCYIVYNHISPDKTYIALRANIDLQETIVNNHF